MKVKEHVAVAENLKKRINETTMNSNLKTPSSTENASISSSTIDDDNRMFIYVSEYKFLSPGFLVNLNKDNELVTAYEHCSNGNQLVNKILFVLRKKNEYR